MLEIYPQRRPDCTEMREILQKTKFKVDIMKKLKQYMKTTRARQSSEQVAGIIQQESVLQEEQNFEEKVVDVTLSIDNDDFEDDDEMEDLFKQDGITKKP